MGGDDVADGGVDSSIDAGDEATVNIRCLNGSKFAVQVNLNETVEIFKSILTQHCEIPALQQRLIYKGRTLRDDRTLQSYGLEADHTVHLVRGFPTSAPSHSAATSHAEVQSLNSTDTDYVDFNEEGWPLGDFDPESSSLLALNLNGSGNNSGVFGVAFPEMDTQNPNMICDNLNEHQRLRSTISSGTIHDLITNNPRELEIMDRDPELVHMPENPEATHLAMEIASSPEIMRKIISSIDRALSNIESSPESFGILRRVYETLRQSLLNLGTMPDDSRSDWVAQAGGRGTVQTTSLASPVPETRANSAAPITNPPPNPWASGALPNPIGSARSILPAGVRGPGLPDLENLLVSMSDITSVDQLLQTPNISQKMHSLLSSPQLMNQFLDQTPYLRIWLDSSPRLRDTLQNPEFIREITSPEMMQEMRNVFQFLSSPFFHCRASEEPCRYTGGMTYFEEIYATQLSELQEMGFADTQENIRALIETTGDVDAAVEHLLGNLSR